MDRDVASIGFWSATVVTVTVALFGLLRVVGFWTETLTLSFIVCLILAPAFVAMMIAIHYQAPAAKRIWSHLGVAAAVLYAVLVSIVYFVQVTVIRMNSHPVLPEALRSFQYTPGTVFFALDILGYSFMALATVAAAPVFGSDRLSVWIRRWFLLQSIFLPGVVVPALPIFGGSGGGSGGGGGGADTAGALILIAWCILFLPLSILVARYFRRALAGSPAVEPRKKGRIA